MPHLHHYDNLGTARFVTFSTYRFYPLINDEVAAIVIRHLGTMRERTGIKVYGYVLMPDHVHLVLHPPDGATLGREIGGLKALSAREILSRMIDAGGLPQQLCVKRDGRVKQVFWQRRCYDHNCRNRETVIEKIEYCHNNPVKRLLVESAGDWKWSSYKWYLGERDVPLALDDVD